MRIIDYVLITTWTKFSMERAFNTIGSTFNLSYLLTEDMDSNIANPCRNQLIKVEDENGNRLFSGFILKHDRTHDDSNTLITIAGYSIPAILGSSDIPISTYPRQYNNMSLRQITERLLAPFDILLSVDDSIKDMVDKKYESVQAGVTEKVADFLASLAIQRDIVMTHTSGGKLLYTSIDASQKEIAIISMDIPADNVRLLVDTESMNTEVVVLKESPKKKNPSHDYYIAKNPFSPSWTWKYSPKTIILDSDDESGLEHAAKAEIRSQVLNSIVLTISLSSWGINGNFVEPNKIIIFSSKELGLTKPNKWFINKVSYEVDADSMTSIIECVRPECYNREEFVNIFE